MSEKKERCGVCGKSFDAKHLDQHKRNAHGKRTEYGRSGSKIIKIAIGMGVVAAIIAGVVYWAESRTPQAIDAIQCLPNESTTYHVHAHLDIFLNGQPYVVPALVGIVPNTCFYWLHTHDSSGVIHIEAPETKTFTLGQFFSIWGKPFNNTQILDNVASDNNTLSVYVNGNKVSGDYRSIALNAHDEIAIVYGSPPSSIPSSYFFPVGE